MTAPIRPIAICVFRDADRILVAHGFDSVKQQHFLRPLGGAIEGGERAADALRREIREEVGLEIEEPRLLGVLENIFTCEGAPGHEIVFVFDARFADPSPYDRKEVAFREDGWQGCATWESLADFGAGSRPVYPDGLLPLLKAPR